MSCDLRCCDRTYQVRLTLWRLDRFLLKSFTSVRRNLPKAAVPAPNEQHARPGGVYRREAPGALYLRMK
jgi:hypothetical protein